LQTIDIDPSEAASEFGFSMHWGVRRAGDPAAVPRPATCPETRNMATKKNPKRDQANQALTFTKIIAAIAKYLTAAVTIAGKSVTPQALSALFTAALQAQQDLDAANNAVTTKKQARNAARTAAVAMVVPLHRYLVGTYGADSPILEEFGFAVATPKQPTTEVKAEAVKKRTATRASKKPQTPPPTPAKA
jgi:hypothetical protein